MPALTDNPFAVFTFIAAPAVLTNAAAVLSLTTSNRLARAVDRARILVTQLSAAKAATDPLYSFRVREVEVARRRAGLLIRAMSFFQLACGAFSAATLVALVGAALTLLADHFALPTLVAALACAVVAVAGIVTGASLVVVESRMAYSILREETVHILEDLGPGGGKLG
jgi:hypothetical protein